MTQSLLEALARSDSSQALAYFRNRTEHGEDPWAVHLALFPEVQRVLNPPFINPHLPKMYRIYRELIAYLHREDVAPLIALEIQEYADRPKLNRLPRPKRSGTGASFEEIQAAIRAEDREKAATLMDDFRARIGDVELAKRLLLLGSNYLNQSLGHSISCTAFILLEMLEREDQDPWPALTALANYFCRGDFAEMPDLRPIEAPTEREFADYLLRAATGRGIVHLHHTITVYAVERIRHWLAPEEYLHLLGSWIQFMGEKTAAPFGPPKSEFEAPQDYALFFEIFSRLEAPPLVAAVQEMVTQTADRQRLGRYFVKGVCDLYQGRYDPHYLTGLGSMLWVINRFPENAAVAVTALHQYIDYFSQGLRSAA